MAPGVVLCWCSLVAAVTSGCDALAPEDQRGGPSGRPFRQTCELPESAPVGVVLEARRTVVPGGESVTEQGQATDASGTCDAGVPDCTRVSTGTLLATYDKIRNLAAQGFLSRNEQVSPHYGWRTFSVKWSAGRCEFVDGVTDPLAEEDKKRFYEAYDAIVALIVGGRGAGTEVLPRDAMAKCRKELDAAIES